MTGLPRIDTTKAHSARVWNYRQRGKDDHPVDLEADDHVLQAYPETVAAARADRRPLIRVVTHLAGQEDVRRFLGTGTGPPPHDNTHEAGTPIEVDR